MFYSITEKQMKKFAKNCDSHVLAFTPNRKLNNTRLISDDEHNGLHYMYIPNLIPTREEFGDILKMKKKKMRKKIYKMTMKRIMHTLQDTYDPDARDNGMALLTFINVAESRRNIICLVNPDKDSIEPTDKPYYDAVNVWFNMMVAILYTNDELDKDTTITNLLPTWTNIKGKKAKKAYYEHGFESVEQANEIFKRIKKRKVKKLTKKAKRIYGDNVTDNQIDAYIRDNYTTKFVYRQIIKVCRQWRNLDRMGVIIKDSLILSYDLEMRAGKLEIEDIKDMNKDERKAISKNIAMKFSHAHDQVLGTVNTLFSNDKRSKKNCKKINKAIMKRNEEYRYAYKNFVRIAEQFNDQYPNLCNLGKLPSIKKCMKVKFNKAVKNSYMNKTGAKFFKKFMKLNSITAALINVYVSAEVYDEVNTKEFENRVKRIVSNASPSVIAEPAKWAKLFIGAAKKIAQSNEETVPTASK